MDVRIRPARLADAPHIAQVHVQAWHETYAGLVPERLLRSLSVERNIRMWREIIARPQTIVLVAEHAGATAARVGTADIRAGGIGGFGSAGPAGDKALGTDGELTALYLIQVLKRRGTGRALFTALTRALAGRGYRRAGTWVLAANDQARRFYEALGGRPGPRREIVHSAAVLREVAYLWDDLSAF